MAPRAEKRLRAAERALETVQVARREKFLAPLRSRLYRYAALHFERQRDALWSELSRRGHVLNESRLQEGLADDIDGILDEIFLTYRGIFTDSMARTIHAAMKGAVRHRIADIDADVSFDLDNPAAQEYLRTYAAREVTNIDATTRKSLKALIARGERAGTPYSTVARQMIKKFNDFGTPVPQRHLRTRAEMIAVHELANAYESASRQAVAAIEAKGVDMEKKWSDTGDDRVSPLCRANSAAGWIPADQAFPSGHDHPPGHAACRCSALYRAAA